MASLYIHIPFCEKKCLYCDFYSVETLSPMEQFIEALEKEIALSAGLTAGVTFSTLFFGGGTPSLLTAGQLERILEALHATFTFAADVEVTLETNPGTVTGEKLRLFRASGVNRLSIGIQSFRDEELRFLSRIHNSREAGECVRLARAVGFDNISLDLIYSLPGQGAEEWEFSLRTALAMEPPHLSAYSLIVEDNTPLARLVRSGQVSPNPLDREADLYERTMEMMSAHGYEHYEVSNYALPGFRSRHNYSYWNHDPYIGLGPSAHSFWGVHAAQPARRWWNVSNVRLYVESLLSGGSPVSAEELVTGKDLINERIFLGLRSDGFDLTRFRHDFGTGLTEAQQSIIRDLLRNNIAIIDHERLRLTPKGYLLCDEVAERLMVS